MCKCGLECSNFSLENIRICDFAAKDAALVFNAYKYDTIKVTVSGEHIALFWVEILKQAIPGRPVLPLSDIKLQLSQKSRQTNKNSSVQITLLQKSPNLLFLEEAIARLLIQTIRNLVIRLIFRVSM